MEMACDLRYFKSVSLPNSSISHSHLMYVDDVTFIGEWLEINFINLNSLLRCVFLASGLKVKLHRSKVYAIGGNNHEVEGLASILKCFRI